MTELDAPAADPSPNETPNGLSFLENIAALQMPRQWVLHAWDATGEQTEEPQVLAALPIAQGDSLQIHLAKAGATRGRWRVQLAPLVPGLRGRHRLDRLQKKGHVVGFVDIGARELADAQGARDGASPRARGLEPRPAAVSDSVRQAREEAEVQKAQNEKLAAEVESARLRAQLKRVRDGEQSSPTGGGVLAVLAPFLPVAVEVVRGWLDNQRKANEALIAAIASRDPVPAAPPASTGLTLESLIGLIPHVRELRKLLGAVGGGSSESTDEEEPRSDLARIIEATRDLLGQAREVGAAQTTGGPSPAPRGAVVPSRPVAPAPRTPEQMQSLRVTRFLSAVLAEQLADADPLFAAQKVFPAIGALPEQFRALIATSENVETLLNGLPRWLPSVFRDRVLTELRSDQRKREWLAAFLDGVRDLATAAGQDAEDGGGEGA